MTKNLAVLSFHRPTLYPKLEILAFRYCSSNKTDMVQISKLFSSLMGWILKINSKNLSFCSLFAKFWGNLHFLWYQKRNFNDHFMRFDHFWLLYHDVCSMCKNQKWFRVNQCWISTFQRWWALNFSVLISTASENIKANQRWCFHVLWISAEKRQISETALFTADYLWDFHP